MRQPSNIPSVNLCIIRLPTTAYSVRQVSDASHRICRTPMIAHSKQQPSHIPDSDRRVFQMPTITYSGRQTSLAPSVDHCTVQVPTIAYSVINHRVPCLHNCLHTSPLVFSFFFYYYRLPDLFCFMSCVSLSCSGCARSRAILLAACFLVLPSLSSFCYLACRLPSLRSLSCCLACRLLARVAFSLTSCSLACRLLAFLVACLLARVALWSGRCC